MVVRLWCESGVYTTLTDVSRVICDRGIGLKVQLKENEVWTWREFKYPVDYHSFSVCTE